MFCDALSDDGIQKEDELEAKKSKKRKISPQKDDKKSPLEKELSLNHWILVHKEPRKHQVEVHGLPDAMRETDAPSLACTSGSSKKDTKAKAKEKVVMWKAQAVVTAEEGDAASSLRGSSSENSE